MHSPISLSPLRIPRPRERMLQFEAESPLLDTPFIDVQLDTFLLRIFEIRNALLTVQQYFLMQF